MFRLPFLIRDCSLSTDGTHTEVFAYLVAAWLYVDSTYARAYKVCVFHFPSRLGMICALSFSLRLQFKAKDHTGYSTPLSHNAPGAILVPIPRTQRCSYKCLRRNLIPNARWLRELPQTDVTSPRMMATAHEYAAVHATVAVSPRALKPTPRTEGKVRTRFPYRTYWRRSPATRRPHAARLAARGVRAGSGSPTCRAGAAACPGTPRSCYI